MMKITTGQGNSGVTLIELLVVVAIIGILALSLAFSYQGWIRNYKIESQTKQLYSDLMEARARALTRNFAYYFTVPTLTSYQIYEDTNNDNVLNPGPLPNDQSIWAAPKKLDPDYKMRMFSADPFPAMGAPLTINTRGLMNVASTMYMGIDSTGFTPDYDCIIVTQDRIRMGLWVADGTRPGCPFSKLPPGGQCCEK